MLSDLGTAYRQRYEHTRERADLEQAVTLIEQAARLPEGRASQAVQADLGTALLYGYERFGARSDLWRAAELVEEVLAGTPACPPAWPATLGGAYRQRYPVTGDVTDLARAIDLGERAVAGTPDDHVDLPGWMSSLAAAYLARHRLEQAAADMEAAVDLGERALALLPAGHPSTSSLTAGLCAAYLERVTTGGDAPDRDRLRELARIVTDAPAAAPGERVAAHHAVGALAHAAGQDRLAVTMLDTAIALLPSVAPREAGWADQQHRLGASFGLVGTGVAAHCAIGDPAGAVEIAELGRIVRSDLDPVAVKLPELRLADVEAKVATLLRAVRGRGSITGVLLGRQAISGLLSWLWVTVVEPVLDALGPRGATPHRVWWLPVGPLGLLPLHAAGLPGEPGALDAMVSSFVPTLRTLQEARDRRPGERRRDLTVALRHTPGFDELPGIVAEAAMLGGPALIDDQATADRVLAALKQATWAHFACHAVADPASQADSGLLLHDRTLRLPEIGGLRLADAELAYLSACSTADHGVRYADEVLHLASAFQLAGLRHVVASLWPLHDEVAAEAARSFYRELPDTPVADSAAAVLNKVTLGLRDASPDCPDLWAPLVHSGP